MPSRLKELKLPWIILSLLVLFVAGWLFSADSSEQVAPVVSPAPRSAPSNSSGEVTLEGTLACLPRKDPRGPHTMECAYGVKTTSGDYYALDTIAYPDDTIWQLPTDAPVRVSGKVTPLDKVSDVRLKTYNILGVIQVTSIEKR